MNDAAAIGSLARTAQEHSFRTHDGVDLFYRHWPAPEGPARGAVLLFHRGHEHSGRMAHLVDELGMPEYDFFAWDARGHGRSPGARGDAPGVDALVRDIDTAEKEVPVRVFTVAYGDKFRRSRLAFTGLAVMAAGDLLLGVAPGRVTKLHDLPADAHIDVAPPSGNASFPSLADSFRTLMKRGGR
jgi:pimeloyl-ACP methyl ester carboxylesterase